jgi:hypothetical protein
MLYARLEGHTLADSFHERLGAPAFELLRNYVASRQRDGAFRAGDPGAMVLFLFAPAVQYATKKYVFGMNVPGLLPDEEMTGQLAAFVLAGLRAPRKRNQKRVSTD